MLIAGPFFRIQERLKGHDTMRRLRELERSQWWSREALESAAAEKLRRFLVRVGSHVPYYRELYRRAGFDPESVRGVGDLSRLPTLTKADIQHRRRDLIAEGAAKLIPNQTGGSTGVPLQFFVGLPRVTSDVAARCRAMRWWGAEVGDPEVVLWAAPREVNRQDRVRGIRDRLLRSTLLAADRMTPTRMDQYLDLIERVRPVQIFSHGSALDELARRAEERHRPLAGLGIRVAFLTAEQLYEHQRRRIERVFGCPVANGYGARDGGFVAHECPAGGMHVTAEDVIVEIIDERGIRLPAGQAGEIVITHLETEEFPFVRYRTGDVASLLDRPCTCGRGLPLMGEIHGRADDLLLGLDGARVPGQAIVHLVRSRPELQAFRIVQEAPDLLRILLVQAERFPADVEAEIVQGVKTRLGEGMRVEFVLVPEIPLEASGKYRTVLNKIGTRTHS
jgi:phenylacetate-CoA ligase